MKKNGFTQAESLITMGVLAVFFIVAAIECSKMMEKVKFDEAWLNLDAIWKAQELYFLDRNEYAAGDNFLKKLGVYDPNENPKSKFKYTVAGPWETADESWVATGLAERGGPKGQAIFLYYKKDHRVEKWLNFPLNFIKKISR